MTIFYIQLPLDVSACSIATCASPGCLFYIYHRVLPLARTCLFYGILCCPWTCPFNSSLICSVTGSICFAEASAALYLSVLQQSLLPLDPECVCSIAACAVPGGIWPFGLCCTWTYLSTRACAVLHLNVSVYESLCCAAPGRICLREPILC